jgi:hypothetical protein
MKSIMDAYIKATGGIVSWLFYMVLNLVSPIVRGVAGFLTVCGGLSFLLMAFMWLMAALKGGSMIMSGEKGPMPLSYEFLTFICLGMALAGMSVLMVFEIKMDRMFLARLYSDDEEQGSGVSGWARLGHFCGFLALFVSFSFAAAHYYPRLPVFAWPAIGFFWWFVTGVALGVGRWFYRVGAEASHLIEELSRMALGIITGWGNKVRLVVTPKKAKASMTDAEIQAAAKAFIEANKVVSFRRPG